MKGFLLSGSVSSLFQTLSLWLSISLFPSESVCKVRTQDPENFHEEVLSLVSAWRCLFLHFPLEFIARLYQMKEPLHRLCKLRPYGERIDREWKAAAVQSLPLFLRHVFHSLGISFIFYLPRERRLPGKRDRNPFICRGYLCLSFFLSGIAAVNRLKGFPEPILSLEFSNL